MINITPLSNDINAAVALHLEANPPVVTIPLPTHTVERVEVQLQPVLVPHTHDKELPDTVEIGQVLTSTEHGLEWQHPHSESEHLYAALSVLTDEINELKRELEVTNEEKIALLNKQADYYNARHPDCFMIHGDGRRIFQPELLTFKHDTLLTELYNREPPVKEIKIVEKHQVQWPMWAAIALLVVVEIIRVASL